MEASMRKTSNSTLKNSRFRDRLLPPIPRQERETKINVQRREKLANTLTENFVKKFNTPTNRGLIHNEVSTLLKRERLNEHDLKTFETELHRKLNVKKNKENLKSNLITNLKSKNQNSVTDIKENNNRVNTENETLTLNKKSNSLDDSRMSGASDLDKFDEKCANDRVREQETLNFKKIAQLTEEKPKKVNLDLSKYANEWDAINMYNKKVFEEQKRNEKIRDWEVRMRTRADLNNQIKQKIIRKYEQELKDKEYDNMMDLHIKHLDELEKKRQEELKQRAIKEKEMRDKQQRELYVKKRLAFLKNKKYEKELVAHNNEEIRLAKEAAAAKKKSDHEELMKTLAENEVQKKKLIERQKKEKEDDIQMMEDALASEQKRDIERKQYFEKIKRAGNFFDENAVAEVYKKRDQKILEEEENMRIYSLQKEKLENEKETKKFLQDIANKKMLKEFYDKQCKERKAKEDFERHVDLIQGRIWNQDYINYMEKEKQTNQIVRELAKKNIEALDAQVKMGKYDVDKGMSQVERDLNYGLLEKAAEM